MDEIGWLFKALRGILHEKPTITTWVVERIRCFSKGNTWHLVRAYKLGFVKEAPIRRLCAKKSTTEINMDGAYSWVICAVCCIANAATCGFYNSYGTLFVAIIQEYQVSETVAGEEILVIFIFMNNRWREAGCGCGRLKSCDILTKVLLSCKPIIFVDERSLVL